MIASISIKNVATYDPAAGVQIDGLKKVNFIYGANGTGKTTITKLLSNGDAPEFSDCSVLWNGGMPLQTLVYNRDFRERNFASGSIDGVFTLGEAIKEEKAAIDEMVEELGQINAEGVKKKDKLKRLEEEKQRVEDAFRDTAWEQVYKKYETVFKDAFSGVMRNKASFKQKLLDEAKNNQSELKSYDELRGKAETLFGKQPVEMPLIHKVDYGRLLEIESDAIWERKIIGKSDIEIAKLIQHLSINDWVNEGRGYLQDDDICPFCQQETITENFRSQLNAYFDKSFEENTQRVKQLSEEYAQVAQNLINLLNEIELKEKENPESKIDVEILRAHIKTISAQVQKNEELVNNKRKEPSRSISLTSLKTQFEEIGQLIDDANAKIKAHNQIVRNYTAEKASLITAIWRFLVGEHQASINQHNTDITGKQKGIEGVARKREELLEKWKELDRKIKEANKNVTSVQPSVDEINKRLRAYGFLNFQIVPSEQDNNQYQIQREDGSIVGSTLSEGEITFITFLYFLQRAKGGLTAETVSEERVLVIDDPISSLDSNVLFVVSTMIKEIMESVRNGSGVIKQIILLTHNVYFHKEVSYVGGRPEQRNDTHFWILRKKDKISAVQSCLMDNPIHTSYELLWRELKNHEENDSVTLQNTMRRIIENYFKILGKYDYKDLFQKFEDSPEEHEICRSLVSWINDGSHTIPDDLFIEAHSDLKDKYLKVFEQIFDRMDHYEHYKMMMGTASNTTVTPVTSPP